jgi:hypothetical protein
VRQNPDSRSADFISHVLFPLFQVPKFVQKFKDLSVTSTINKKSNFKVTLKPTGDVLKIKGKNGGDFMLADVKIGSKLYFQIFFLNFFIIVIFRYFPISISFNLRSFDDFFISDS